MIFYKQSLEAASPLSTGLTLETGTLSSSLKVSFVTKQVSISYVIA